MRVVPFWEQRRQTERPGCGAGPTLIPNFYCSGLGRNSRPRAQSTERRAQSAEKRGSEKRGEVSDLPDEDLVAQVDDAGFGPGRLKVLVLRLLLLGSRRVLDDQGTVHLDGMFLRVREVSIEEVTSKDVVRSAAPRGEDVHVD